MTTIKNLVAVLAAVAATSCVFAQTEPVNPALSTSAGRLGFSYAEAGVGYIDGHHGEYDSWSTGLELNTPVAPNFDVRLDYSYSWAKSHGSLHANDLSASGIYYLSYGALKPFAGLTLGHDWQPGDNRWTWGATAGVEYQVAPKVLLTGSVNYNDDFKRNNDAGYWSGDVAAHYWFTRQIAGFGSVTWFEGGDVGYAAGVTYRY